MENAIKSLLDTGNEAIVTFTKKELLEEKVNIKQLWILPKVKRILKKQQTSSRRASRC